MGGIWLSLVQMRKRNASQLAVELAGPWPRQHLSPPVSTLNPQPQAQTPGLLKLSVPTPLPDMQRFTRSSDGREQPNLGTSPCPRSYPVMTWRKVIHARKGPADTSPEEHTACTFWLRLWNSQLHSLNSQFSTSLSVLPAFQMGRPKGERGNLNSIA